MEVIICSRITTLDETNYMEISMPKTIYHQNHKALMIMAKVQICGSKTFGCNTGWKKLSRCHT